MKKYLSILLAVVLAFALAGCASNAEKTPAESAAADVNAKSEGVMTYAEYTAADLDSQVTIEAYVQAKQSWWENQATVYTQDADGAYFLSEWSSEVEITDATFEIEEGSYVADAKDVTDLLGQDSLIDYQNQFVSFKGLTVEAADDAGAAYLYKWDGSGSEGDDLYFNVSKDGNTYTFTVESYLCGADTDVYKAVKNLKVGDTVDLEGFLYWYEGVNPHITSVTVK